MWYSQAHSSTICALNNILGKLDVMCRQLSARLLALDINKAATGTQVFDISDNNAPPTSRPVAAAMLGELAPAPVATNSGTTNNGTTDNYTTNNGTTNSNTTQNSID